MINSWAADRWGFWYHWRYHLGVAMTVRFDEEETAALRKRAAIEGRSMQEVTRAGVREYIERHSRDDLLEKVLAEELPRYAEALDRLGK